MPLHWVRPLAVKFSEFCGNLFSRDLERLGKKMRRHRRPFVLFLVDLLILYFTLIIA